MHSRVIYFYIPDSFLRVIFLQFCFLLDEMINSSPKTCIFRKGVLSCHHTHSKIPSSFCSQHRILSNQVLPCLPLSSPSRPPSLLSPFPTYLPFYFYGSDIHPLGTKVCALNSSLSASLAIRSINQDSPNSTASLSLLLGISKNKIK